MLLKKHSLATTSNIEEMISGIRSRSPHFRSVAAKYCPNWEYTHNAVNIGSVRVGVSKASYVSYQQEPLNDIVVTGLISGAEEMSYAKQTRNVNHQAGFSPIAVQSGLVQNAAFWTVRIKLDRLENYLHELELNIRPISFIEQHWLSPLPGSAKFSSFIQYIMTYLDSVDTHAVSESRAIEELIYINVARLMEVESRSFTDKGNARIFRRCIDYIENNLSRDIAISDIVQISNLSIRGLQYLFKNMSGSTITQYIMERRLLRAYQLLSSGNRQASVQEVGAEVGIENLSYFSRAYRKRFGVPPSVTLRKNI